MHSQNFLQLKTKYLKPMLSRIPGQSLLEAVMELDLQWLTIWLNKDLTFALFLEMNLRFMKS